MDGNIFNSGTKYLSGGCMHICSGVCGVVVSMLATRASGPGSIPVAGGKKREINFSAPQH